LRPRCERNSSSAPQAPGAPWAGWLEETPQRTLTVWGGRWGEVCNGKDSRVTWARCESVSASEFSPRNARQSPWSRDGKQGARKAQVGETYGEWKKRVKNQHSEPLWLGLPFESSRLESAKVAGKGMRKEGTMGRGKSNSEGQAGRSSLTRTLPSGKFRRKIARREKHSKGKGINEIVIKELLGGDSA